MVYGNLLETLFEATGARGARPKGIVIAFGKENILPLDLTG